MAEVVPIVDVLLEMGESRKRLSLRKERSSVAIALEKELGRQDKDGIIAYLSPNQEDTKKEIFLVQRWDTTWNAFVDVTDVREIESGDRLAFCPRKCTSPQKVNNHRAVVSLIVHINSMSKSCSKSLYKLYV